MDTPPLTSSSNSPVPPRQRTEDVNFQSQSVSSSSCDPSSNFTPSFPTPGVLYSSPSNTHVKRSSQWGRTTAPPPAQLSQVDGDTSASKPAPRLPSYLSQSPLGYGDHLESPQELAKDNGPNPDIQGEQNSSQSTTETRHLPQPQNSTSARHDKRRRRRRPAKKLQPSLATSIETGASANTNHSPGPVSPGQSTSSLRGKQKHLQQAPSVAPPVAASDEYGKLGDNTFYSTAAQSEQHVPNIGGGVFERFVLNRCGDVTIGSQFRINNGTQTADGSKGDEHMQRMAREAEAATTTVVEQTQMFSRTVHGMSRRTSPECESNNTTTNVVVRLPRDSTRDTACEGRAQDSTQGTVRATMQVSTSEPLLEPTHQSLRDSVQQGSANITASRGPVEGEVPAATHSSPSTSHAMPRGRHSTASPSLDPVHSSPTAARGTVGAALAEQSSPQTSPNSRSRPSAPQDVLRSLGPQPIGVYANKIDMTININIQQGHRRRSSGSS